MSPEQARGRAVDRRTDIWAFGAVLFEMLTGRRAFEGDDAPGIFAEVLKTEPAWETLPGDVTAAVAAVLRRCLEKEPFQRMRDIADVRMGLHGAFHAAVSKTGLDGMRVRIAAIGGAGEHDGRTGRCLAWAPSPPLLGTEPAIEVVAKAGDGCDELPQALNLLPVVDGQRTGGPGRLALLERRDPSRRAGAGGASSPIRSPSGAAASLPCAPAAPGREDPRAQHVVAG